MTKNSSALSANPSFLNRLSALLAPMDMAVLQAGRSVQATTAEKPAPRPRRNKISGTPLAAGF